MLQQSAVPEPRRILVLDDELSEQGGVAAKLVRMFPDTEIRGTHSLQGYLEALNEGEFDIVVLDYDLPDARNSELLAQLKLRDHEPDVLIVSKCDEPDTIRRIAEARTRYVVKDEGLVDSLVIALRDMIRIRRLEREVSVIQERLTVANAKLEDKNRRLDDFCATIAHDIRGPLAGLILKTEYIVDTYADSLDERCVNLLKRSAESAHRLVGVVQGMYEFAKVGAGVVRFDTVELQNLVSEVLGDLNVDDSLEIKVGVGELPQVWGNPALLRRVFVNLVSNSVKYSDKDEVRINIGCSGEVLVNGERFAQLYVEDNGPGIAKDDIATIFDMFRRGRSHKHDTEGMGIGLAVVQRIVELHHGEIELASKIGHGCRFTFLLPVEPLEEDRKGGLVQEVVTDSECSMMSDLEEKSGPIRHCKERV
jgi:signal transduction histidine kinase